MVTNDFKGFMISMEGSEIDRISNSLPESAVATNDSGVCFVDLEILVDMGDPSNELEALLKSNNVPEDVKILLLF